MPPRLLFGLTLTFLVFFAVLVKIFLSVLGFTVIRCAMVYSFQLIHWISRLMILAIAARKVSTSFLLMFTFSPPSKSVQADG